ncbi:hypothetical protein BaRGS_00020188, partial [Batillaria attramentaria]
HEEPKLQALQSFQHFHLVSVLRTVTKWAEATMNEGEHFLQFDYFDDSMTVSLIMAASKCLELPLNTVLETFGDFFLKHCLRHGYDNMLRTLGRDMKCESEEDGTLTLHYYSCREGLSDIVKGVVRAVGTEIFNQNVRLELISTELNDLGAGRSQEHSVFTVYFLDDDDTSRKPPEGVEVTQQHLESTAVQAAKTRPPRQRITLSGELFCETFPYHVIFDENLTIHQCGDNLERMLGVDLEDHPRMPDAFLVIYPRMNLTMANIQRFINSIFVLAIVPKDGKGTPMSIKGQMLWLEDQQQMMYIGSPLIKSLKEMKEMDVYMADIPLFDVTREIVLLYEQRNAEIGITRQLDLTTAELQRTSKALDQERRKTEELLHEMLPPRVAKALMNGEKVEAETFKRATIMFSDVVTFTNIAAACPPEKIVDMLNDMYERFDTATTRWNVYKVETIGDAYMVVSGVPERTKDHAQKVARFAMDIVGQAAQVPSPATGKPLQIRVGIHTGPVMAGVVGIKMPRYCLFGDTVNTASRMESHGVPGRIHLSPAAFRSLRNIGFTFKRRGEMEIKGKGKMVTHFLIGDGENEVHEPEDSFSSYPLLTDAELILDDTGDHYPEEEFDDDEMQQQAARERGDGESEGRKESAMVGGTSKETGESEKKPDVLTSVPGIKEAAGSGMLNASVGGLSRAAKPDYSFLALGKDMAEITGTLYNGIPASERRRQRNSKTCSFL